MQNRHSILGMAAGLALLAGSAQAATFTFTNDAHWDLGTYTSTNSGPPGSDDQVQLDPGILTPFDHIWVALSGRDGVVRIDTNHVEADGFVTLAESAAGSGAVLGEYLSRPAGMSGNPSRTTVDQNGDVWVGNRNQASGGGSATKISASPTGTTSTGVWNGSTFDRLAWANGGSVDSGGGTSTATDTAILNYVRTAGTNVRTVAIDSNNDVWVGGFGNKVHQRIDGATGAADPAFGLSPGGYGGLVDGNGILWSSGWSTTYIARYDTGTVSGTPGALPDVYAGGYSYGLAVDTNGNIWNTHYSQNTVSKLSPTGVLLGTYGTGGSNGDRGVAVTPTDNNVWVANSWGNNVSRLDTNGNILAVITVGNMPTGVSVDSNGKVWVTNYNSNSVSRIDPTCNCVDLTIDLGPGANPYNYSDMTGTTVTGTTNPTGTWLMTLDSGVAGNLWDEIFWNTEAEGLIPTGASIIIDVRFADTEAGLAGAAYSSYLSGASLGMTGQWAQVRATLNRTGGIDAVSPILSDLRLTTVEGGPPRVPEPSTLVIFATGGLVLAGLRRRRRKTDA